MFYTLLTLIFIPLIISQVVTLLLKKRIERIAKYSIPITILLLSIIIAGVIGEGARDIISNLDQVLYFLVLLYAVFFIVQFLSYFMVFWLKKEEKLAVSISKTYGNPILGIVLASTFFSPKVALFLVLSEIPWNTTLAFFNWFKKFLP